MLNDVPLSIGGVLDAGIRLYRSHFLALTRTASIVFGAVLLINLVFVGGFGVDIYPVDPASTTLSELYTPSMVALSVVGGAVTVYGYAALLCQLGAAASGSALDTKAALRAGLRRALPVALSLVLYVLLIGVGMVLLVLPGIWAATALGFAFLLAADGSGPIEALRESVALVRGHWWRTTLLLAVITLLVFVLSLAFGGLAGFAAGYSAAANAGPPSMGVQLFSMVMNTLGSIFVLPIALAMSYAVCHDLKLRKSGQDLEARLDGLDA